MPLISRCCAAGAIPSSAPITSIVGPTMTAENGTMKLDSERMSGVLYFFRMLQLAGLAGSSGPLQVTTSLSKSTVVAAMLTRLFSAGRRRRRPWSRSWACAVREA